MDEIDLIFDNFDISSDKTIEEKISQFELDPTLVSKMNHIGVTCE
jgi:hypothetical protein